MHLPIRTFSRAAPTIVAFICLLTSCPHLHIPTYQVRLYCTSSAHDRIMHFKTSEQVCWSGIPLDPFDPAHCWFFCLALCLFPCSFLLPAARSSFGVEGKKIFLSLLSALQATIYKHIRLNANIGPHSLCFFFFFVVFAFSLFTFLISYGRQHHLPLPSFAASD